MELLACADYYGARGTKRAWQWLASEGITLSLKTFQTRLRIEKEHRRKRAEEATQRTEEATPTTPALPLVDAGRAVPLGASLVDAAVPGVPATLAPTEGTDNLARIGEPELKSLELEQSVQQLLARNRDLERQLKAYKMAQPSIRVGESEAGRWWCAAGRC